MNKNIGIAVLAVLMGVAGNAAAVDFDDLGGMTAAKLSAAEASSLVPSGEKGWIKPPSPPVQPASSCPANWFDPMYGPVPPVEWIPLRGGGYTMGTNDENKYYQSAKPPHRVSIKPFEMSKSEVTVGQYRECFIHGQCTCPKVVDADVQNMYQPITGITWEQANDYAKFAGGRLPTEAEWEYAATNEGSNVKYPWGNTFGEPCEERKAVVFGIHNYGCGEKKPWPVCSMKNGNTKQGLCDMIGNVSEWVQDSYLPSYEGAPADGSAVVVPGSKQRVLRGGHVGDTVNLARSDHRYMFDGEASWIIGFRVARDGK